MIYNAIEKHASRREIRELQNNNLSDDSIQRVAQNNIGQNERLIKPLGHGFNQNADLVLHPGIGPAVRKSHIRAHEMSQITDSKDWGVVKKLKDIQDERGDGGGFARVHHVDDQHGLTTSEYLKGRRVSDLTPNEKHHYTS